MKYTFQTVEAIIDYFVSKIHVNDPNVLRETRPCDTLFDLLNGYLLRTGNDDLSLKQFDFEAMDILIAGKSILSSNAVNIETKNQYYYTMVIESFRRLDLYKEKDTKKWAKNITNAINKMFGKGFDAKLDLTAIQELNKSILTPVQKQTIEKRISKFQADALFKDLYKNFMLLNQHKEMERVFYKFLQLGKHVIQSEDNRNNQSTVSMLLGCNFTSIFYPKRIETKGLSREDISQIQTNFLNTNLIFQNLANVIYDKCTFTLAENYTFTTIPKEEYKTSAKEESSSSPHSSSASMGLFKPGNQYDDKDILLLVKNDECETIRTLASKIGFKVKLRNYRGICGRSLLHMAAIYGNPRMVELLIDLDLDVNVKDTSTSKSTPLEFIQRIQGQWLQNAEENKEKLSSVSEIVAILSKSQNTTRNTQ